MFYLAYCFRFHSVIEKLEGYIVQKTTWDPSSNLQHLKTILTCLCMPIIPLLGGGQKKVELAGTTA